MNVFKLIEDNGLNLHGDIEHVAELIAKREREACAVVCEDFVQDLDREYRELGFELADRIRRGSHKGCAGEVKNPAL